MTQERLILFTRFPEAGRVKTRLVPTLGAEGAAALHREMTEHVLARLWPLSRRRGTGLEVRFDGGSAREMRRWLGRACPFVPQGGGDLGNRLARAASEAFADGADAMAMVGSDCPDLDAPLVERAFDALRGHDLVFGPAKDGGYYLVGMRRPCPWLFEDVAWGGPTVLETSLALARRHGIEPFLLPELSDVDEAVDLGVWGAVRQESQRLSIVIPALNEAGALPVTLARAAAGAPAEILVADGGGRDGTRRVAAACGAKVVDSPPGRARQMNAGAAAADGSTLLFLHADTLLPEGYGEAIAEAFRQPDVVGGAFRFRIADAFVGRALVERATNLRSRLGRMPYGDQAIFVRRWAFDVLGGFPELPLMEDYEFVRRLKRLGRIVMLDEAVLTSGRRWIRSGVLRTTLVHQWILLGYRCGVPAHRLASFRENAAPGGIHPSSAPPSTTPLRD